VTKHRHKRLRSRIDTTALAAENDAFAGLYLFLWRELVKQGLIDHEIETGIATLDGVADPVVLATIEEDNLIGFRNGLALADVTLEDPAIGIDEACLMGAFFIALVPTFTIADDIADEDAFRLQQYACRKL
jgi:hypothetical protein